MDLSHGKYLGVDYGDVRTGIAECDISGMLASGITTVKEGGMRKTAERVKREAESRSCKKIVIGLPKNMDGSEGFRAETVRAFVELLKAETDIPVDFSDERLSTCEAHRYLQGTGSGGKKRKNVVDTLSAQIILQDYLDREKNSQNR